MSPIDGPCLAERPVREEFRQPRGFPARAGMHPSIAPLSSMAYTGADGALIRPHRPHRPSARARLCAAARRLAVCEAPIDEPCRPLSPGDQALIESGRLFIHGDRRRAWQMYRSGEMKDGE